MPSTETIKGAGRKAPFVDPEGNRITLTGLRYQATSHDQR